jgi:hypothetical protein
VSHGCFASALVAAQSATGLPHRDRSRSLRSPRVDCHSILHLYSDSRRSEGSCCCLQNPQIGLAIEGTYKEDQRIVVGAEVLRHPALPAKGAVEHPTKCNSIDRARMDTEATVVGDAAITGQRDSPGLPGLVCGRGADVIAVLDRASVAPWTGKRIPSAATVYRVARRYSYARLATESGDHFCHGAARLQLSGNPVNQDSKSETTIAGGCEGRVMCAKRRNPSEDDLW